MDCVDCVDCVGFEEFDLSLSLSLPADRFSCSLGFLHVVKRSFVFSVPKVFL